PLRRRAGAVARRRARGRRGGAGQRPLPHPPDRRRGGVRPTTVLIVDDEPLARSGLRRLVERHGGCTVGGEGADGAGAARDLVALRPDVVLLDVQMPEMDGFAALRAAAEELPALPVVVFITAHDRFAVEAFEAQALDYLVKPFTDERFAAALT